MIKYIILTIIILGGFSGLFTEKAKAESAFPDFPMSFYGVAKLDGNDLAVGTKILVYSGTTLVGETLVEASGVYGYDSLVKKRLVVGEYSGELIFKYQMSGSDLGNSGINAVKYSQNFVAGSAVLFNINFVSVSPAGNGGSSSGGGGGGGSSSTEKAIVIPVITAVASTTIPVASGTPEILVLGEEYDASVDLELIIKNTIEGEKKALGKIDDKLVKRLVGRILLQVEAHGEAWYVNPKDLKKYYMADGNEAYRIMRYLGVGITNKDLEKIKSDKTFAKKHSGKIFLQVEAHGEAFYIDINGNSHYLKNGIEAYNIMRNLGLGISNIDLRKIGVGEFVLVVKK